jgi:hypothetical protein
MLVHYVTFKVDGFAENLGIFYFVILAKAGMTSFCESIKVQGSTFQVYEPVMSCDRCFAHYFG